MHLLFIICLINQCCFLHGMEKHPEGSPNTPRKLAQSIKKISPRQYQRVKSQSLQPGQIIPPLTLATLSERGQKVEDEASLTINDVEGLRFFCRVSSEKQDSPRRIKIEPTAIAGYSRTCNVLTQEQDKVTEALAKLQSKDPAKYEQVTLRILNMVNRTESKRKFLEESSGMFSGSNSDNNSKEIPLDGKEDLGVPMATFRNESDNLMKAEDPIREMEVELLHILKEKMTSDCEDARKTARDNKIAFWVSVAFNVLGLGSTIGLAIWGEMNSCAQET